MVDELKITDLEQATIGQVVLLASRLEELTGIPFIRMDQGVPGLEPWIGTEAEKQALIFDSAIYPWRSKYSELKTEETVSWKSFSGCRYFGGGLCPGNRIGGRVVRIVHRLYPV